MPRPRTAPKLRTSQNENDMRRRERLQGRRRRVRRPRREKVLLCFRLNQCARGPSCEYRLGLVWSQVLQRMSMERPLLVDSQQRFLELLVSWSDVFCFSATSKFLARRTKDAHWLPRTHCWQRSLAARLSNEPTPRERRNVRNATPSKPFSGLLAVVPPFTGYSGPRPLQVLPRLLPAALS